MLVAGHETTAAVLTWALFELTKNPELMKKAQDEIDRVVGDREPTLEDVKSMEFIRLIIAEVGFVIYALFRCNHMSQICHSTLVVLSDSKNVSPATSSDSPMQNGG